METNSMDSVSPTSFNDLRSSKFSNALKRAVRSRYLLLMILPPLVYLIIFCYVPIYGAQIAFKDYSPFDGVWGSRWVGFENFMTFFKSPYFVRVFRNTLVISLMQLLTSFPAAVLFALMLNEVRIGALKKTMQTIASLPHFVSTVVVVGIAFGILSPSSGIVNSIVKSLGGETIYFFNEPKYFPFIISGLELWQNTGWNAIIFLAAITGIDPGLYESAVVDGASRFKQMIYITLPCILPTVVVIFIMKIGQLFTIGYQRILLLYNPTIYETADIIQTYVYRRGIYGQEFSFGTAVDLFNSVLNLTLVLVFNKLMRKISEVSLW